MLLLALLFLVTWQAPDARERAWQANNLGVAWLEQFNHEKAAEQFESALAIDGSLVAARVNLAIAQLYIPDLEAARRNATAAAAMPDAPPHADFVLGLIARIENREDDALAAFRRVLARDPDDVASLVNVGQLLLQQRAYAEAVTHFSRAVALEPYNVSALYNLAIAQTRSGDREAGMATTQQFQTLRESGYGTTYANAYLEQGRYAEAILSTGAEPGLAATGAPVTYVEERLPGAGDPPPGTERVDAVAAGDLDKDGYAELIVIAGRTVRAGALTAELPAGFGARGAIVADVDNDGTPDLVVHGAGGVRVLGQAQGAFTDVTAETTIATTLDVRAVALVDLDHDGDLDLVFGGVTRDAAPAPLAVWRNNGNGSFTDITATALPGQAPLAARAIVPTDIDQRRDIDLVVLGDDGGVRVWRNMRDASFREQSADMGLSGLPRATAIAVGDLTKDGYPDLALVHNGADGVPAVTLAIGSSSNQFTPRPASPLAGRGAHVLIADANNDGHLEVVATDLALDVNRDGVLDLVSLSDGVITVRRATGVKPGVRVALVGQTSNRSGVGAKIEMRAGSLWQQIETSAASPAAAPAETIFGLGTHAAPDVVRVLWPAGIVQAEPVPGTHAAGTPYVVTELDRKPSSCPYLFTWNGDRFEFVTDFLGGGETGYQLAPGVFNTPDPEEFVRIAPGGLVPREGAYELRITNELEETLFLDHLSLLAVDHAPDEDVFPLEGMVSSPTAGLRTVTVRNRRSAARVLDAAGNDATAAARDLDRTFVGSLPLLPIRGYAEPHAVTIDLGADTPAQGAVLLLTGWTDYAFSSDNVAASQAGYALQPPSLQVRDAKGEWVTVIDEIGIPVGRPQTIVVDLTGRFRSASREVRIATSMRVYWDRIEVATRVDGSSSTPAITRLPTLTSILRWRGFSEAVSRQEPLTFDYARVTPFSPWKQMPGRYTREGDVLPLLAAVDDAFVVARPGDEVVIRFDASTPVPSGRVRTFLLHADGFSKEMDINSENPDVVLPLPRHRTPQVTDAGAAAPADWYDRYNTRVVTRQLPRLAAP